MSFKYNPLTGKLELTETKNVSFYNALYRVQLGKISDLNNDPEFYNLFCGGSFEFVNNCSVFEAGKIEDISCLA